MNTKKIAMLTKEHKTLKKLIVIVFILLFIFFITLIFLNSIKHFSKSKDLITSLHNNWEQGNYQEVYSISKSLLQQDYLAERGLTFKGYSALYLSMSEKDLTKSQLLLDESINSLRCALNVSKNKNPQIYYMLGKAYFFKNSIASYHYYSDLAIKYFELAVKNGFSSSDIPEYLGLCYGNIDMVEESIAAFTEALLIKESDILLFAIAQQYAKKEDSVMALQYLNRILSDSENELLKINASILYSQLLVKTQEYDEAKIILAKVLEKMPNNVDAIYTLGTIYEALGDSIKARAEWRKILKIQVNHQDALNKLKI